MIGTLRRPETWASRANDIGAAADRHLRTVSTTTVVAVAAVLALGQVELAFLLTGWLALVALAASAYRASGDAAAPGEVERLRAEVVRLRAANAAFRRALETAEAPLAKNGPRAARPLEAITVPARGAGRLAPQRGSE
jgi:hypothetical protein